MIQKIKNRIFVVLNGFASDDFSSRIFYLSIIALIFLNVFAVILETVENLSSRYLIFFKTFEMFSVFTFTLEYLLRLWTCTADTRFHGAIKGRI
ncbi:MAG: hypothetical protein ACK41Q_00530 [Candidatus Brocadia sp.]